MIVFPTNSWLDLLPLTNGERKAQWANKYYSLTEGGSYVYEDEPVDASDSSDECPRADERHDIC